MVAILPPTLVSGIIEPLQVGVIATGASFGAFVQSEYMALNAQEMLYRPKMEQDLREFIELKREETKAAYRAKIRGAVNRIVKTVKAGMVDKYEQAKLPRAGFKELVRQH